MTWRGVRARGLAAGCMAAIGAALLMCAGCVRQPEVEEPTRLDAFGELNGGPVPHERRTFESISRGAVYAGLPIALVPVSHYDVLANEGYTIGYSERRRNALWAAYELFPLEEPARRTTPHAFTPDVRTTARVEESCYAASGYARGRHAPTYAIGARYGASAQQATLLMSNVSPRLPKLERQTWRALERLESDEFAQRFDHVWVLTGPIFEAEEVPEMLACGVEVPNGFYKIIVAERDGMPIVLPVITTQEDHGKERLRNFTTTVDRIERLTGLDFFPELPVAMETAVESSSDYDPVWDVDRMLTPPESSAEPRVIIERR